MGEAGTAQALSRLPSLKSAIISIMFSPAQPPTAPCRSRIVEWDARRGFGYVDHEGTRLFLHRHDFFQKGHSPRKGDTVSFVIGIDDKGRSCARAAQFLHQRGFLKFRDLVGLFFLLVIPGLAAMQLPWALWMTAAYVTVVSFLSFTSYQEDKNRARIADRIKVRRISEATLHFFDIIGGWPGGFLAQRQFRHKTAKASYQFFFRGIVFLYQAFSLDFLLGWPAGRFLGSHLTELLSKSSL